MEQKDQLKKKKGGRPKKDVIKNKRIPIKCTSMEKIVIEEKAKSFHLTVSEYLLQKGMEGHARSKVKTLPKEVLALTGNLNQIGALLNQLARKHNSVTGGLNLLDSVNVLRLADQIKELALTIKNHVR